MKKRASFALAMSLLVSSAIPTLAGAETTAKNSVASKVTVEAVKFNGMEAPKSILEMATVQTKASVDIKYSDGSIKNYPLEYKTLFKSDDSYKMDDKLVPAGTPLDVIGNPIIDHSVPGNLVPYISDAPDANSLLMPIAGANGKLHLVSHFEYDSLDNSGSNAYGKVPASMSITTLTQDKISGELKVAGVEKIDFSGTKGLWIPCNGSLSPWNTHLGSEEYEPDARTFESEIGTDKDSTNVKSFAKKFYGKDGLTKANPYWYGFVPEVTVSADGKATAVKHYSTGRFSKEIMRMMPDQKTAYFGDDGGNTMMFMYIADKPTDLSSGTLYAAKFKQTGTDNGGAGNLTWIKLGHATDSEIEGIIEKNIKFSDIFEVADKPTKGFTAIKTYANKDVEYLKVKPGMKKAAAFLESRRYGAMLGATSEFNKMEGIAVNGADKKLYMAIADQSKAMEANKDDLVDHIQLPKYKSGVTYELPLRKGMKDTKGFKINSEYVATSMKGLVIGQDLKKADEYGNTANPNLVASPDNLSYSETMKTLFIGEDSGMHTNNFVWAYNVETNELSRILSVPAGAEATGLMVADDRNGFPYIMSNFQHPGDEVAAKEITAVDKAQLIQAIDKNFPINKVGAVGYISGLPTLTQK